MRVTIPGVNAIFECTTDEDIKTVMRIAANSAKHPPQPSPAVKVARSVVSRSVQKRKKAQKKKTPNGGTVTERAYKMMHAIQEAGQAGITVEAMAKEAGIDRGAIPSTVKHIRKVCDDAKLGDLFHYYKVATLPTGQTGYVPTDIVNKLVMVLAERMLAANAAPSTS